MKRWLILLLLLACALPVPAPTRIVRGNARSQLGVPPPDLLWCQFTEGSGTITENSAAAGLSNGVLSSVAWVTGKSGSGYAIDFDGAASDLWITNVPITASVVTVMGWGFLDTTNPGTSQTLWEVSTNFNYINHSFRVLLLTSGLIQASIHGTTANVNFRTETSPSPSTNAWVHFATVLDNTTTAGDIKFFLDGVEKTGTVTANTKNATGNYTTTNMFFGARSVQMGAGNRAFLNGKLDDVRIYSGELTSAQIQAIMNDPR